MRRTRSPTGARAPRESRPLPRCRATPARLRFSACPLRRNILRSPDRRRHPERVVLQRRHGLRRAAPGREESHGEGGRTAELHARILARSKPRLILSRMCIMELASPFREEPCPARRAHARKPPSSAPPPGPSTKRTSTRFSRTTSRQRPGSARRRCTAISRRRKTSTSRRSLRDSTSSTPRCGPRPREERPVRLRHVAREILRVFWNRPSFYTLMQRNELGFRARARLLERRRRRVLLDVRDVLEQGVETRRIAPARRPDRRGVLHGPRPRGPLPAASGRHAGASRVGPSRDLARRSRRVKGAFRGSAAVLAAALCGACASGTDVPNAPETRWAPPADAVPPAPTPVASVRSSPELSNRTVSLYEAIDVAFRNSPVTRQSWLLAQAAAADVGSRRSAYYPAVEADLSAVRQKQSALGGSVTTLSTTYAPSIGLSWLLLDLGGRGADVEEAKRQLYAADFTHNATMNDLGLAVAQSYYSYQGARALLVAQRSEPQAGAGELRGGRGAPPRRRRDDRGRPPGAHRGLAAEARLRPGERPDPDPSRPARDRARRPRGPPDRRGGAARGCPRGRVRRGRGPPHRRGGEEPARPRGGPGPRPGRARARRVGALLRSADARGLGLRRPQLLRLLRPVRPVHDELLARPLPAGPALHRLQDRLRHAERGSPRAGSGRRRRVAIPSRSRSRSGTATTASRRPRSRCAPRRTSSRARRSRPRSPAADTARASARFSTS